jgi:pimeloyl-ACP methyl ester carboxylesterase
MRRVTWLRTAAPLLASLFCLTQATALAQESIDVGGHKIEISRAGRGGPTVVFEAGITDLRLWGGIQPRIAEFAATVSYSHSGIGGSEPSGGARPPERVIRELHTLLSRAGLEPPYVLVGHSMGGLYARLFAIMYPREIAGLVLVDGAHERQVREFTRLDSSFLRIREAGLRSLDPGPRAEMDGLAQILATGELGVPGKLPDVPMVVLTSTHSTPPTIPGAAKAWRDLHTEIFQSSTYGMHIVTSKSGHLIQKDEPDLVVNAIRWVVEAARTRK